MKRLLMAGLFLLLAAGPPAALAQDDAPDPEEMEQALKVRRERLMRAIRLPKTSQDARRAGVPEEELKSVLRDGRQRRVPPSDMDEVLEQEVRSVEEHGPIDNFGAFVQARLGEGLRGRELAAAIRAEHAARGKGKGHLKKMGKDGKDKGKKAGKAMDDLDEMEEEEGRKGQGGKTKVKAKRKGDGS